MSPPHTGPSPAPSHRPAGGTDRVSLNAPGGGLGRGIARRLLHSRLAEALTFPHGVDSYVEMLAADGLGNTARAEVIAVRHQTNRSVTLTLAPDDSWQGCAAGQSVAVSVLIDGVRETRPYSPAGSQHAVGGSVELTISTHPEGRVSQHLRHHAREGLIVGLAPAQGQFVLPSPRPQSVLLISAGSAITPAMAILRTLCDEGYEGDIGFLNYARSPQLALYGPELAELAQAHASLRVARGLTGAPPSRTRNGAGTRTGKRSGTPPSARSSAQAAARRASRSARGVGAVQGRFCAQHLSAVGLDGDGAATYVCGPPALIASVGELWEARGLPEPIVESFTPLALAQPRGPVAGHVSFLGSGRGAPNTGLTLLEQAEDAGLTPAFGCRMGICNTCSTRKASGTVRNLVTGAVCSATDEQIRLCVCVPVGDVALDL